MLVEPREAHVRLLADLDWGPGGPLPFTLVPLLRNAALCRNLHRLVCVNAADGTSITSVVARTYPPSGSLANLGTRIGLSRATWIAAARDTTPVTPDYVAALPGASERAAGFRRRGRASWSRTEAGRRRQAEPRRSVAVVCRASFRTDVSTLDDGASRCDDRSSNSSIRTSPGVRRRRSRCRRHPRA